MYIQKDAKLFIEKIELYYKNQKLNQEYPGVDLVLPIFVEESNKSILLNKQDIVNAAFVWKTFAKEYILLSVAKNKNQLLELLNDEIKFQTYLWNRKWNEHVS